MQRIFRPYHYPTTLAQTFRIGDLLSPDHPARLLADFLATCDLTELYARYYPIGPHPYDPRVLLALVLYGYMTGVQSSRKLERAVAESVPFMYLAAGTRPDHSTLAEFRTLVMTFLPTLFEDVLLQAKGEGHLTLQGVSHDGTKIHADASKHRAVSYQRAGELIHELHSQIEDLLARLHDDPASLPAELDVADEIAMRRARIARLQEARQVLEARAEARYQAELDAFEIKQAARAERARVTGRKPGGKPPTPPTPDPAPTEQYNFTDPDSRIMKNSTNTGVDQHYNGQLTVDHASRLIVACTLSNHPADTHEALPTLATIPAALGTPQAVCLDAGYWSPATVTAFQQRGITPYIAVGKIVHGLNWSRYYGVAPATPPPPEASPQVQMAYQLQTSDGQALYRQRKSTVEPVIGIIKEILDFRQFSLRGAAKAQGEWRLVCLAYNLKRLFTLRATKPVQQAHALQHPMKMAQIPCCAAYLPRRSQPSPRRGQLWTRTRAILREIKATARR